MEILAALFTSLLGLGGLPGTVIDRVATDVLRRQLIRAEQLEVRVDNTPNYQLLQGKLDRIRVAGRGLYILEFFRIDALDLETDPISIDPASIQSGNLTLLEPAQAAVRLVLKDEDINQALRSPDVVNSFRGIRADISNVSDKPELFDLLNPEVTFLGDNRVRVTGLAQPRAEGQQQKPSLAIAFETGFNVIGGTRLELTQPTANLQGVNVPEQIVNAFIQGLNKILDLRQFEAKGITVRILKFEVEPGKMQLIGFARMETKK